MAMARPGCPGSRHRRVTAPSTACDHLSLRRAMKDSSQVRTMTVKSPTESTTSTLACGADRSTVEVMRHRRPRCPPPSVQTRTTSVAVCSSCVSMLATVAASRHPVVTGGYRRRRAARLGESGLVRASSQVGSLAWPSLRRGAAVTLILAAGRDGCGISRWDRGGCMDAGGRPHTMTSFGVAPAAIHSATAVCRRSWMRRPWRPAAWWPGPKARPLAGDP